VSHPPDHPNISRTIHELKNTTSNNIGEIWQYFEKINL
jgi:hypothetical protein